MMYFTLLYASVCDTGADAAVWLASTICHALQYSSEVLRAVHALLRRAALLGTWLCNTLQRAVPALLRPTRSDGTLRCYTP